jgi:hypothetical protein
MGFMMATGIAALAVAYADAVVRTPAAGTAATAIQEVASLADL